MNAKTYRVSDALGSLFETYILDGLSDGDAEEPELYAAYSAVADSWDRKRNRIAVRDDQADIIVRGMIWALNSLDGEPQRDRERATLIRSGNAFCSAVSRQSAAYQRSK